MRIEGRWLLLFVSIAALGWLGESPTVTPAPASWATGSWGYRIPITVKPDSIQGQSSLLDISLLLRLGPSQGSVFAHANANGSDLLVTKADGTTVLGHEVVTYNPGTSQAEIWFRADTLSKTVNKFYLYYGNPSATTFPSAGAAWNSKYLAVYHFSENPGQGVLKDWGPRGNNGNAAAAGSGWTAGDVTTGQIGQAWNFNGTTHYLQAFGISTPDTSYVISTWLKLPSHTTDFSFQSNPGYWHVSAQINQTHRQPHFNAANPWRDLRWGPDPIPDDDQYHWYTWVFDGEADTVLFYFDGVQQPGIPWSLDPSLKHYYTGFPINPLHNQGVGVMGPMYWNSLDIMTGPGDEFRLNERTHSPSWVRTEYRNQRDPDHFYVFGSEEPGGSVPVVLLGSSAVREGANVRLRWEVASTPGDLSGFLVFREEGGNRTRLTPQVLLEPSEYTWLDMNAPAGAVYWLEAILRTGDDTWLGPIRVSTAPGEGRLIMNARPNPFRENLQIAASLWRSERVIVRVIDTAGRQVRTLHDQEGGPGMFQITWDARDDHGRRMVPGAYLVTLQTGGTRVSRKVLLLP